jgi:hypothetical protein
VKTTLTSLVLLASLILSHGLPPAPVPYGNDTNNLVLLSLQSRINALSVRNNSLSDELATVKHDVSRLQTWLLVILIILTVTLLSKCYSAAKRPKLPSREISSDTVTNPEVNPKT